jgi:hypothetical protein
MKRLVEEFGANTMQRDPLDIVVHPDIQRSGALMFYSGSSGQIPAHWNNSPFLSGGRLTSAFGANPRSATRRVLRYEEFIDSHKQINNKKEN